MSTTKSYSKVPTYLESAGIYSLHYPAEIRHHSRYTLDPSRTNATLDNVASGTKLKGNASIGMTWNGTDKRVFALADLAGSDGTLNRVDTTKHSGIFQFYVKDEKSGRRRLAVACGVSEIGPSQYDASVLFITTDLLDPFPVEGAEEAPIAILPPMSVGGGPKPFDLDGWLI
jgi:hypothetical protein